MNRKKNHVNLVNPVKNLCCRDLIAGPAVNSEPIEVVGRINIKQILVVITVYKA